MYFFVSVAVPGLWTPAGPVKVFYKGRWGYVCHHNWDINDADVVCRELGLSGAIYALPQQSWFPNTFVNFSMPIILDDVSCNGSESSILNCQHGSWKKDHCEQNDIAWVFCLGPGNSTFFPLEVNFLYFSGPKSYEM